MKEKARVVRVLSQEQFEKRVSHTVKRRRWEAQKFSVPFGDILRKAIKHGHASSSSV